MKCSEDPMLPALQAQLSCVKFGVPSSAGDKTLAPILSNTNLFGVDLCQVGLSEKISQMMRDMIAAPGAVLATLTRYLVADRRLKSSVQTKTPDVAPKSFSSKTGHSEVVADVTAVGIRS